MSSKKVAFLDTVHPALAQGLEEAGWECFDFTKLSFDTIQTSLNDIAGIVVRSRFPMDETLLKHANQLEFIARSGAGMENIDTLYCAGRGITLFNAPEGNRNAVAEHALGMLLSLLNHLNKGDREIRQGIWDREGNRGHELDGRTVGIIGYGNNGAAFAKKLRGFDVRIMAYDKYKSGFGDEFVEEVSLTEIQECANVVSLHIPETPETVGLIGDRFIDQMDHPFYLLNMARGTIVSIKALIDGIDRSKILGACLDVLEFEKKSFENIFEEKILQENSFKKLMNNPKVLLSPHVAGWTVESYEKLSTVLLEKILNHYSLSKH
jgi:D-3-phosphoglycerate dehydrogenase